MKRLDGYSMMIVGKYFMTSDDYRRIILVNSKYSNLLEKYRYNPHRDLKLFPNIETQVLYCKIDNIKEGMYKYVISYDITYKEFLQFPENIRDKMEFRNLKLTDLDVFEFATSVGNVGTIGTELKEVHYQMPLTVNIFVIPDKINSIDINAFNSKHTLREVIFPKSLTSIGNYGFKNCGQLKTIKLPENLRVIGNEAFRKSISEIIIPNKVKKIGVRCFEGCRLVQIKIPMSVYELGSGCFENNNLLTEVILSPYIDKIPSNLFFNCSSLASVIIPEGIVEIGNKAFSNCGLTSLTIPNSITSIGFDAFDQSRMRILTQTNKQSIEYQVSLYEAVLFGSGGLKCCNIHFRKEDFPYLNNDLFREVVVIEEQAFMNCRLNQITLPSNLKEIGSFAFYECPKLTSLVIPTTVTLIGTSAFFKTPLKEITIKEELTEGNEIFDEKTQENLLFYFQ